MNFAAAQSIQSVARTEIKATVNLPENTTNYQNNQGT